jgi:4-amino-4-deoxy-L-arabinose transferase-like glycosyltransferase
MKQNWDRLDTFALIIGLTFSVLTILLLSIHNEVLLYDDKAYLNNALVYSGRIPREAVQGPFGEERPPLLWWILATILSTPVDVRIVNLIIPFFSIISILGIICVARSMYGSRAGYYAALILGFNAFFVVFSSQLLTDVPGLALGVLFLLCLYKGIIERRSGYLIASGPILAFSLMMRDQNLILIPIAVTFIILAWNARSTIKALVLLSSFTAMALPVYLLGLTEFLRRASDFLTPVVLGSPYKVAFTSVSISNFAILVFAAAFLSVYGLVIVKESSSPKSIAPLVCNLILTISLFLLLIYPYLWDNYSLGASFAIAGKGIFSRLVSHQMMAETIGVGSELTYWQRRLWWLESAPNLLSPVILALASLGLIVSVKKRYAQQLSLILPWLLFTTGFTVLFTQLEARFLMPSLAPMAILSGVGLSWLRSRLGRGFTLLLPLVLAVINIPLHAMSIGLQWRSLMLLNAVRYLRSRGMEGWWSNYIDVIKGYAPSPPILDPAFMLISFIGITLPVALLLIDLRIADHLRKVQES